VVTEPGILLVPVPKCLLLLFLRQGLEIHPLAKGSVEVPVWAFHGTLDRNVSVNGSRDIIEAMRQAGGNPRYTEYPNIAHGAWGPMKNNPEIMDWLFAQKRE
jgi:predicted peptidase